MASKKRRRGAAWRWRDLSDFEPGLRAAIKAAGGTMTNLARLIDIAPQAIAQWNVIPVGRVLDIERATKVDREKLRPDLFKRRRA